MKYIKTEHEKKRERLQENIEACGIEKALEIELPPYFHGGHALSVAKAAYELGLAKVEVK